MSTPPTLLQSMALLCLYLLQWILQPELSITYTIENLQPELSITYTIENQDKTERIRNSCWTATWKGNGGQMFLFTETEKRSISFISLGNASVLGKLVASRCGSSKERIFLVKCRLKQVQTKSPLNTKRRRVNVHCRNSSNRYATSINTILVEFCFPWAGSLS